MCICRKRQCQWKWTEVRAQMPFFQTYCNKTLDSLCGHTCVKTAPGLYNQAACTSQSCKRCRQHVMDDQMEQKSRRHTGGRYMLLWMGKSGISSSTVCPNHSKLSSNWSVLLIVLGASSSLDCCVMTFWCVHMSLPGQEDDTSPAPMKAPDCSDSLDSYGHDIITDLLWLQCRPSAEETSLSE